jgi:hypothetical protein
MSVPRIFSFKTMTIRIFSLLLLTIISAGPLAKGVYQEPDDFVHEVFAGEPPPPKALWITKPLRDPIEQIMGHPLDSLRVRYWTREGKIAWILEEIGKDLPITTGIVVNNGKLKRIKVLIFRESRGWEVRHDFFTHQFTDATLTDEHRLDRTIDGIAGATLSVRALTKLAQLALFLSEQVTTDVPP